jgi:tetratricopeptide (TPR) repeat protein
MGISRALACVLIASTTLAHAQPNKPSAAQIQQAGDLVKKAIAKSQAGDHTLAIELYQQAYIVIPNPVLLSNIGSEYQSVQRPADAVKYFCKYLEAEPDGANATYATTQVKALQGQLGNDVDDSDVCHAKAKPPAPQPPPVDTTPLTGTTFEPTEQPPAKAEEPAHPGRALTYTGVAVAVVGAVPLVLGIHYALEGRSLSSQIDAHIAGAWPSEIDGIPIANWKSQGEQWNRQAWTYSLIGGGAVVVGGVLVAIGVSRHNDAASSEHAKLVPTASAHHAGLALVGRF